MLRFCCVFLLLCFSLPLVASERYCPDRPLLLGLFYYGHIYREDRTGIDHDLTFSASQAEAWQQLMQQLMQQGELSRIYHAYLGQEEACQLELAASPKAALCAKGQ